MHFHRAAADFRCFRLNMNINQLLYSFLASMSNHDLFPQTEGASSGPGGAAGCQHPSAEGPQAVHWKTTRTRILHCWWAWWESCFFHPAPSSLCENMWVEVTYMWSVSFRERVHGDRGRKAVENRSWWQPDLHHSDGTESPRMWFVFVQERPFPSSLSSSVFMLFLTFQFSCNLWTGDRKASSVLHCFGTKMETTQKNNQICTTDETEYLSCPIELLINLYL